MVERCIFKHQIVQVSQKVAALAARHLAGAGLGRSVGMAQAPAPEPPKRGMHRTVTGSHMDLSEMENLISGASLRGQETETSSVASSSQTGRSNIVQVCATWAH